MDFVSLATLSYDFHKYLSAKDDFLRDFDFFKKHLKRFSKLPRRGRGARRRKSQCMGQTELQPAVDAGGAHGWGHLLESVEFKGGTILVQSSPPTDRFTRTAKKPTDVEASFVVRTVWLVRISNFWYPIKLHDWHTRVLQTSFRYSIRSRHNIHRQSTLSNDSELSGDRMLPNSEHIRPVHTTSQCHCRTVTVDRRELGNILSNHEVPLLKFIHKPDQAGALCLKGYNATACDGTPFVAISHVRSAGLGNDDENALPSCQLLELQTFVNDLDKTTGNIPIWLDTLCLPVNRKNRKAAIQGVYRIFSAARYVLVLDPKLIRHTPRSATETLVQIRDSLWKKRLWTLDEGFFAKTLLFRFKTGAVSLSDLVGQAAQEQTISVPSRVMLPSVYTPRPWQMSELEGLILRFGDDVRLLSYNESFGEDRGSCRKLHLYKILRLGYLMADKFRHILEDDERSMLPELWQVLLDTYGSVTDMRSLQEGQRHSHGIKMASQRLGNMLRFSAGSEGNDVASAQRVIHCAYPGGVE